MILRYKYRRYFKICRSGGIGRHAWFRTKCLRAWRFEPSLRYHDQCMIYIILFIILLLILITFFYSIVRAISWVPMWSKDLKRFLQLAEIKSGQKVYDLGCGDGKLLFAASSQGAKATGFEISIMPYIIAKIRQLFNRNKVTVKFRDFWMVDLSDADVVFFFLIPRIYPKLKEKLQKELKPGAKVIAYVWPFDDWQPTTIDKVDKRPTMYLYKVD